MSLIKTEREEPQLQQVTDDHSQQVTLSQLLLCKQERIEEPSTDL